MFYALISTMDGARWLRVGFPNGRHRARMAKNFSRSMGFVA